tara:strand:+ start:2731 stop:3585 length:855 start_codon:yes stop_codon:yes gene_type:complete
MAKTLLNTKQVASLFRVDTSTIRRWSLSGKLNCSSSRGGHRKFTYRNILDFVSNKKQDLKLDLSQISTLTNKVSLNDYVELISSNALDRNYKAIESILVEAYLKGIAVSKIFDDYLDKGLAHVQSLLDAEKISVAEEHISRKTISIGLEHFRSAILKDKTDDNQNVLCLNLENDIPDIAIDMIQICLEMKSHSVYNSGSNTSIKGLKSLLHKTDYDAMYIFMCNRQCCSATVQNHISHTINNLEEINKMCQQYNISLHIGGPATRLIDDKVSFKYNKFLKFSEI